MPIASGFEWTTPLDKGGLNTSSMAEALPYYFGTMDGDADIAPVAALIGDPTRAAVLMALLDGRALAASTLAAEVQVAPSTLSEHLARLVEGGLVTVEPSGRHRYFRLAGPEIAHTLEALAFLAPAFPVRSLRQGTHAAALRQARTCYDHLAGRLGVALCGALVERRHAQR